MEPRPFTIRLFNTFEPVTTFYRDLIPYWESLGWQVDVIVSSAQYRSGRDQAWASGQTCVHIAPGFGLEANGRFAKLLIMLAYLLYAGLQSLFGRGVDRNVFLTHPPLFFVWGYVLQKLRGQPYYIVLMDLYPDVAIEAGIMNAGALPTRFLLKLSRFGLTRATGVIVIGRCMQARVQALGVPVDRIHLAPNWMDQERVVPLAHAENEFRTQMGWQDKFVVLYSGNTGTSHFFDDILEVSRRLQNRPDIVFAFIGHGQRWREIEAFRASHPRSNIELLPFQPLSMLSQSLGAGDVHFVSLRAGYTGLVVPSKVYGVLAAGRPLIFQGDSAGEMAHLVTEHPIGAWVALGDADGLEAAILRYATDGVLVKRHGRAARTLLESQYSKQQACEHYVEVLASSPRLMPECEHAEQTSLHEI